MSPQDRDILKLKKYINSFGLKLYTRKHTSYSGSAEYVTGRYITLFTSSNMTKTDIILSLLHELGHHLDWINNRKTDKDSSKALDLLVNGPMMGNREDIPKRYRKKILQIEKNGIKYMSTIHKELKLEIPLYKVKYQQELDVFDYKFLYDNGRFATYREYNKVYKKIDFYKKRYLNVRKKGTRI